MTAQGLLLPGANEAQWRHGVESFLQSQPVGMAGLEGTALSRQLGNEQGALPFTAVFDARGTVVQRKLGQTSYDELKGWAQGL
jgi:hypothetical protein